MPAALDEQQYTDLEPDILDVDDFDPPDDGDDGDDGDGGGEPVRWTTVATFWQPHDAHVARLRLEAHDIPCFIADENLVAMQWLYANAVGGVKLQVPLEHVERSRELLGSSEPRDDREADLDERCPRCGSTRITMETFSRRFAFLSILLLGAPLPFLNRTCRCHDCGATWKWSPLRRQRGFPLDPPAP